MVARKRPVFLKLFWLLAALPYLLPAQTTVSLSTSLNPSKFGAAVILSATVTPATAAGRVTFYDGVTVLGTKALVSGAASISTIALPAGSRKLRAYYAGGGANAAATSNVVTQIVNAQASAGFAARNLLSTPVAAVFAAADFNGDGNADLVMNDGSAFTIGVLLSNGNGSFQPAPININLGFPVNAAAVGDFNGDGKTDFVATTSLGNAFKILLGNGDGSFQPLPTIPFPGPSSVSVGDFNGDGKADLLILNGGLGGVSVLLGNGDGTFQSPVAALAGTVFDVVIGDFNGDGKTDLAHRTYLGGANVGVSILLGKGDGTFQQGVTYPIAGDGLVSGDFNGDGKPDLVLTVGNPDNTQSALILLGNGDGTFQIAKTYAAGKGNYSAVVGDWNSDSKPDLASVSGSANVTLLLGNGDGTFQSPTLVPIPNPTYRLLAADLNGDGKPDLITDYQTVLLGKGDGTFQPPVTYGSGPRLMTAGDFN